MTFEPPDLAALRAYVEGTLGRDEAEAIRTWLIVAATEDVLEIVEALAVAAEHARVRQSYWSTHPLRARLARLAWHARSEIGNMLQLDLGHAAPVFGTLGSEAASPVQLDTGGTVVVRPGIDVEVLVTLASPAWCGAYAVDDGGGLLVLPSAPSRRAAGTTVELGGVRLEADETLDVFVVFDEVGPLPVPPDGADGTWMADVLTPASKGRSVITATLQAESMGSRGKQR